MPPLTIMAKPASGRCNMRCRYCFYADVASNRSVKMYENMSLETLERLVRRALAYADDVCSFAFQGGEPTLAGTQFYEKLIEFERKYNTRGVRIENSIQTNGYDIPDDMIDLFARERFLVGVSLDGAGEAHDLMRKDARGQGTSERIARNIERLKAGGVAFNILCVVNAHVAKAPERTFDALSRYGYLQFIACLDDFDRTPTDYSLTPDAYAHFLKATFDRYERAFFENRPVSVRLFDNYLSILLGHAPESCAMRGTCATYYLVEGDGSVYPCDFYVLDEWRMGNVNDDSFFKLAKSPVGERFRAASAYVEADCRACKWYALCRGGCKRDREPFVGGHPGLNTWCESYKALFEYAYPRMARMAEAIGRGEATR